MSSCLPGRGENMENLSDALKKKPEQSRYTEVQVSFAGTDITSDIKPFLTDITYTDAEEDESDDLQINLQDREGKWLLGWLESAIQSAAASKLKISAVITPKNQWPYPNPPLKTGVFEVDSVTASGPPSTVSISGAALPYSAAVRQTKKTKAWEKYTLSGIANEVAGNAGLKCMYESSHNPYYDRKEQNDKSDIEFLKDLAHDAGLSLKCTDGSIILFDQTKYESMAPIMTIKRGDKSYNDYSLQTGSADIQYSKCHVSYVDPTTGSVIQATYSDTSDDKDTGQTLEIKARCSSSAEAYSLAQKWLRMKNKFARTASFTFAGRTSLVAGVTVNLADFGAWSGKYMVKTATHTVGSGGYTTKVELRKVVSGY